MEWTIGRFSRNWGIKKGQRTHQRVTGLKQPPWSLGNKWKNLYTLNGWSAISFLSNGQKDWMRSWYKDLNIDNLMSNVYWLQNLIYNLFIYLKAFVVLL